jgi:hypothetical protein
MSELESALRDSRGGRPLGAQPDETVPIEEALLERFRDSLPEGFDD